ncbi:MAG: NUDIX domain-containing protein [Pseudomonadota bacterium]
MEKEVKVLNKDPAYTGYFRIDKLRFQHTRFDGKLSEPIERELFDRGQVAAVLVYDNNLDALLLVEQCRVGAIETDYDPWLMEIVAGMVEDGENPDDVVAREALEEAGCNIFNIRPISSFFTSPGGTCEIAHLFFAESDLSSVGGIHGLAEEGEDIAAHVVPRADVFAMLKQNEFINAKTIVALQWFALNFDDLYPSD